MRTTQQIVNEGISIIEAKNVEIMRLKDKIRQVSYLNIVLSLFLIIFSLLLIIK